MKGKAREMATAILRAGLVVALVAFAAALACSIDWSPGKRRPSRAPAVDVPATVLVERGSIEARVKALESQFQDLRSKVEANEPGKGADR